MAHRERTTPQASSHWGHIMTAPTNDCRCTASFSERQKPSFAALHPSLSAKNHQNSRYDRRCQGDPFNQLNHPPHEGVEITGNIPERVLTLLEYSTGRRENSALLRFDQSQDSLIGFERNLEKYPTINFRKRRSGGCAK